MKLDYLLNTYDERRDAIKKRLQEFGNAKSDDEIFAELCFCLLTPQSRAKICWAAIESLKKENLLFNGPQNEIEKHLAGVRFANVKAGRIVKARMHFPVKVIESSHEFREWLVGNICGFGYKEASHFLRNIGMGEELAILDRHILKNLVKYSVIPEVPKTLTRKRYLEIEERMKKFSKKIGVPLAELDLLFWSEETGEIFK